MSLSVFLHRVCLSFCLSVCWSGGGTKCKHNGVGKKGTEQRIVVCLFLSVVLCVSASLCFRVSVIVPFRSLLRTCLFFPVNMSAWSPTGVAVDILWREGGYHCGNFSKIFVVATLTPTQFKNSKSGLDEQKAAFLKQLEEEQAALEQEEREAQQRALEEEEERHRAELQRTLDVDVEISQLREGLCSLLYVGYNKTAFPLQECMYFSLNISLLVPFWCSSRCDTGLEEKELELETDGKTEDEIEAESARIRQSQLYEIVRGKLKDPKSLLAPIYLRASPCPSSPGGPFPDMWCGISQLRRPCTN